MRSETEAQLTDQRNRWNGRSVSWDHDLEDPNHYANFENGYERFLDFANSQLWGVGGEVGMDLGCGTGIAAKAVLEGRVEHIILLDIAEDMLKEARKRLPEATLIQAEATQTSLPNHSIDIAVSRGILVSHLPKEIVPNFFGELKRIVKPGGMVIFDFLCYQESADFKLSSPKTAFTLEQMTEELTLRNFGRIKFEGDNKTRVVRVAATSF